MTTAAVIPAHNEAKRVSAVAVASLQFVDKVILVDDGSTDSTWEVLQGLAKQYPRQIIALHHQVNLGKGAALKTGCDAAMRLKLDAIVCLDSDGQHNPASIPQFTAKLSTGNVDVVFGARTFNSKMPMMMLFGNRFLSQCINSLFRVMVQDTQSGFRAFTALAYQELRWHSSGYEVETEMIVRTGEHKLRYTEVDIDTIYHDNYKGTTVIDGLKIFFRILRWKLV
jgi:glycosyltransferase involved in cell wall biosynthesis